MPPSNSWSTVALTLLSFQISSVAAIYSLVDNFTGSSFFSGFNFFSDADPTHGFTRYLPQSDAQSQGLISVSENSVYIGVDYKNKTPNGRPSVRLESKKLYKKGLFVLDAADMPASVCGTWPSFWTWGSEKTWPENGEIDIIEGIHTNTINAMSLHTADGCSIDGKGMLGAVKTLNCFIKASDQTSNAGCGIESSFSTSFGTPFNNAGGGVYAMEWTSTSIKSSSSHGRCDFEKRFGPQTVVLDTAFCGDWAGAVWGSNPTCKALASECSTYVSNNPDVYKESYWRINYLKIFQQS